MHHAHGCMGMTKHGKGGRSPHSPRYKFMQTFEDNRNRVKKPKAKLPCASVAESVKKGTTDVTDMHCRVHRGGRRSRGASRRSTLRQAGALAARSAIANLPEHDSEK
jgi:hypothetical protein